MQEKSVPRLFLEALGKRKAYAKIKKELDRDEEPPVSFFALSPEIHKIGGKAYYCFQPKEFKRGLREAEEFAAGFGRTQGYLEGIREGIEQMIFLHKEGFVTKQKAIRLCAGLLGWREGRKLDRAARKRLDSALRDLGFSDLDIRKFHNPSKPMGPRQEPIARGDLDDLRYG